MKINEIIRKKREALSLTQKQVADYLGVSFMSKGNVE